MKNIAIDGRFWRSSTGGIGRYTRCLVSELAHIDSVNSYTVIITPEDEPEYKIKAPNFKKLVVDIPHYSVAEQRNLPAILNKESFDLIHFCQFNHPILYRGKFVVTIHDIIMHLFPGYFQKKSPVRKLAYRAIFNDCKRAKRIIVPSQSTKDDLVNKLGFPIDKINVTPEGSAGSFNPNPGLDKSSVLKKYSIPDKYIIFVSRWEEYKGIPALLKAFKILKQKQPGLGLVICGRADSDDSPMAKLIASAQENDRNIITPGFVKDEELAVLYSCASAYVHPSWYEGFGIMILEAFASGVPVVASNVSSLPEVVGDAGLLVDPHNPEDIAQNILKILTDDSLAQSLRLRGLERVKQYSWRKMAEQTLEIYTQVLSGSK